MTATCTQHARTIDVDVVAVADLDKRRFGTARAAYLDAQQGAQHQAQRQAAQVEHNRHTVLAAEQNFEDFAEAAREGLLLLLVLGLVGLGLDAVVVIATLALAAAKSLAQSVPACDERAHQSGLARGRQRLELGENCGHEDGWIAQTSCEWDFFVATRKPVDARTGSLTPLRACCKMENCIELRLACTVQALKNGRPHTERLPPGSRLPALGAAWWLL